MLARVVEFDGVTRERMAHLKQQIEEGDRPEEIPATEIMVLHDPEAERSLAILLFADEDAYRRGDQALNAMDTSDTPGGRRSVTRYEVAVRLSS
jgi:hypothetical protein